MRIQQGLMFCQKCGVENKDGAAFCNSCGVDLRTGPEVKTKQTEIIAAKIATKKEEINNVSEVGPVLVFIVGFIICLSIVGAIIGIPLILFSIWWGQKRENEKKKLLSEIKELEVELN